MIDWTFILIITLGSIFVVIGDLLARYYLNAKKQKKTLLLIFTIVTYLLGCILFAFSLKMREISIAITIFSALNILILIPLGNILFKEKLKTKQIIAIVLVVIAIILIGG